MYPSKQNPFSFVFQADKLDTMFSTLYTSTLPTNTENTAPVLYFSTWLLYHVLRLMIRYILSGFELELFSVHEYPYLYWYLYELLYPWLTTCLHKADSHLQEYEQYLENLSKSNPGGKKPKKNNKNKTKKLPRPYVKELTNCQAFATLCSGYFKVSSEFFNFAIQLENQVFCKTKYVLQITYSS